MSSKRVSEMTDTEIQAMAGQAPNVVKIRLSGTAQDITAVIERLIEARDVTVLDQSGAYPNRRDPGMRVYVTLLVRQGGAR